MADTPGLPDLPDEAELVRWANALFKAAPGADDSESAAAAAGGGEGLSYARDLTDVGPAAASPASAGGFGASPGAALTSLDAPLPLASLATGAGLPPLGLVHAPGINVLPPSAGGFGASPAPADPGAAGLYIVADAARPSPAGVSAPAPAAAPAGADTADWLTPRSDLMPGSEDIDRLWTGRDAPEAPPAPQASVKRDAHAHAHAAAGYPAFDVAAIRRDFPILQERINGRPLVWFDNGATTQKPQAVIDRIAYFYAHENSNVHRGAHTLAARATDAYENARKIAARFLNASGSDEIVFTRGATEAINLVAKSWGAQHVGEGDEILISHLEHHANIVPWRQLADETGARLRVIPVDDSGQLILSEFSRLLSDRTRIVAVTHVSNALGTVVPIEAIIAQAHAAGAKVLIDSAQSIAHAATDVQALDADFLAFSGHKIYAPTGIGVLYGKRDLLNQMRPWQGGGNMIDDVTFDQITYQDAPARFEAGTGNLADAVGLGAALDYVQRIGLANIARHEHELLEYATAGLRTVPGLTLFGEAPEKVSVLSFLLDGFTPQEVGGALDRYGVAVRAGHHCAQPILRRFGVEATVRASIAMYNSREDVDCLVQALRQISVSRNKS